MYGLTVVCYQPYLTMTSSLDPTGLAVFDYIPLPNNPNCAPGYVCPTRGQCDWETAKYNLGRLYSIEIDINNQVTNTAALTEVVAHEIGHTFGLKDCVGCTIHSSVMDTLNAASSINSTVALPGPSLCDVGAALQASPDYTCAALEAGNGQCYPEVGSEPYCGDEDPDWNYDSCEWQCELPPCPVLVDTTGKGFILTNAVDGVSFDMKGNGHPLHMGWTAKGSADGFLALPGPDGLVHNGKQLFGNFTAQPPSANPNGFAALALYDLPENGGNSDGVIDEKDAIWPALRVWIDANHDGICQPEEMHTLSSLGINSISLHYTESRRVDQFGNQFRYKTPMNPDDPDEADIGRLAYDVFFVTGPVQSTATHPTTPDLFSMLNGRASILAIATGRGKVHSCPKADRGAGAGGGQK